MSSPPLHISRSGLVTTLTLALPEKRNALGPALVASLDAAFTHAFADGTRLILLKGEGPSFCSGFDFSDLAEQTDESLRARFTALERLLVKVYTAPVDVAALVHGSAVGAGADLVASCAHRIGDASAKLRFPGVAFGLVLGTRRLGTRIGTQQALHLVGSRGVDASVAATLGLLSQQCDVAQWSDACASLLAHIQTQAPETRALILAALRDEQNARDASLLEQSMQTVNGEGLKQRITRYLNAGRTHA